MTAPSPSPGTPAGYTAFRARSGELADQAMRLEVVRDDRCGGYYVENGKVEKMARPKAPGQPGFVNRDLLIRHFKTGDTCGVIGTYLLTAEGPNSVGKKFAIDIDNHEGEDGDPDYLAERNERYAVHLHEKSTALGFRPLAATWGGGSYHVSVFLNATVPGRVLNAFGEWLVADAKDFGFTKPVEVFPKQREVPPGKFGNWLRIFGRHHTRKEWAKVFDGEMWVENDAAIDYYLSLAGDDPAKIPAEVLEIADRAPGYRPPTGSNGTAGGGDRFTCNVHRDVLKEYSRSITLDVMVEWLSKFGQVTNRTADRVEFVRHGKDGGLSFNVQLKDGMPLLFNFSSNAGLPVGEALTPAQLRCFLDRGSCDKDAMREFAAVLKKLLGWEQSNTKTGGPKDGKQGAAKLGDEEDNSPEGVILFDLVRRYGPVFRRGNAVVTKDGETVTLQQALDTPTSAIIARLATAEDAPTYKGGGVNRNALPGHYRTWGKVAWGNLLAALPDEDTAVLDEKNGTPAREEFHRLVKAAMLSEVVLGDVIDGTTVTQTERRSMIDWCYKFAKPGPWRGIRSKRCWTKAVVGTGGELTLKVAIRVELFGQLRADRRLCEMPANTFTRRCERYGVGAASRSDRPHGLAAVVLADVFVKELLDNLPDDEADGGAAPEG